MAIRFACPHCGRPAQVDDKFAGKTGRCPECRGTMQIPVPSVAAHRPFEPEPVPEDVYGLSETASVSPPRLPERSATAPAISPKPKKATGSKSKAEAGNKTKQASGLSIAVVAAFFLLRMYLRNHHGNAGNNAWQQALGAVSPPVVVAAAPAEGPAFSPRGAGAVIRPGVRFFETRASGPPNVATVNMTAWVYFPDGPHQAGSLPCVVVAPAGSTIISGMDLGDGDRAEHLPYVTAGYAVLSYSIDGYLNVDDPQKASDAQIGRAGNAFVAARAGLDNARAAINWMLKNFPEVDPERLYAAGHSSAGTLALLLCENDPRFKACASFAPRSNTEANVPTDQLPPLRRVIPGIDQIFSTFNPVKHAGEMKCPVLLFHAKDDSVVPISETEAFVEALRAAGKRCTIVRVNTGNHYDPMINRGIPRAMAFFAKHGSGAGQGGAASDEP
jgi:dienelactone hydrolase